MISKHHIAAVAAVVLMVPSLAVAQASPDPSGHWEGVVRAPGIELAVEFDLTKNLGGQWAGTFSQPAQNISGFPLSGVSLNGNRVTFEIRATGGGPFPERWQPTMLRSRVRS